MKRVFMAGLAALFAGGMSIAMHAWSQTAPEPPRGPHGTHADRPAPPLPSERVEPMLAYAKASLKITPAQESAWNAVADVIRKHAKAHDEDFKKMRAEHEGANPPPRPNAIDALQKRQQQMTQRAKELDELLTAAKPLYASLSDEQKRAADRLLQHGPGGFHGGPHMMMRGPH